MSTFHSSFTRPRSLQLRCTWRSLDSLDFLSSTPFTNNSQGIWRGGHLPIKLPPTSCPSSASPTMARKFVVVRSWLVEGTRYCWTYGSINLRIHSVAGLMTALACSNHFDDVSRQPCPFDLGKYGFSRSLLSNRTREQMKIVRSQASRSSQMD